MYKLGQNQTIPLGDRVQTSHLPTILALVFENGVKVTKI